MGRAACGLLALLAFGVARPVGAENRVASNLSLYSDDDHTDVITSVTRVSGDPWSGGTLEASYLIDIISSASIDVVSSATDRFDEKRQAIGVGGRHDFGGKTLSLNYGYSHEPDYDGHGVGASFDMELAERNATLGLSYALEISKIGRSADPTFSRDLLTHAIDVKGSQILTPWLLADFGYSLGIQDGYTAKPYRYARIGAVVPGDDGLTGVSAVPEQHPDFRMRHALYGGLKAHLGAEHAVESRYRLYLDSWGLNGHTVELLGHLGWTRSFGARLRYRFYWQNAANFWQFQYDEPREFMTRDRELSPLSAHMVGLKVFGRIEDFWVFEALQLTAKFDGFRYSYRDFPLLPHRMGFVMESGVEVVF
ncbi:MAG: DUF3570 domain-containing protein [Myxococcales bacterium]|nr:DUF3570 domain-containing protein [Myxococcales bacterium]MCB9649711.1 DUF3570 domain-containing protein [Deltaproteobacteria bacterium]